MVRPHVQLERDGNEHKAREFMDMSTYQSKALRTESPITDDLLARYMACESLLFNRLQQMYADLSFLKLDAVKKFIFYGRKMDDHPEIYNASAETIPAALVETARSHEVFIRYIHGLLGEITEVEEKLEAVLKSFDSRNPMDTVNLLEENGDSLWYLALQTDALGSLLGKVASANIKKLQTRYPEKFTDDAANNRSLDAERKVLDINLGTTVTPSPLHGITEIDAETA